MSNRAQLERYIPMVTFISEICGKNYEVILHDVSDPENSVISIFNGHLSGRKVGDPMTELARNLVRDQIYETQDFIANYEGRTRNGKQFVSSTYFIKEHGTLIGLICINHDVSDFFAISQHLHGLMRAFSLPGEDSRNSYTEDLDDSIPGLSTTLIHNTVLNFGVPPSRMTPQEKEQVIQALEHQGVFSTKGSVGQAAKELNISEPTVYRYLRRIRTRGDSDV
ncbi:helix-turn-helix transcriptional regulator [Intestinimonas butyriciproducens]|jgi:predicted transcriptional regulator YheO|uniref:helix-turn-helix transcriptional regulator n=1 Tax=Intestinimonas butyriciproducens TaxID=1297617 RepID=UPI001AB0568A|nr:PAS domain-containing protein [Intestinimonas butyriciproducens]MBO3279266.1 helix-turn-helix domain-containing protein [Intestinimonas butyriciproducens]